MSFNFDVAPFYDDFEAPTGADVNNYMRILFRPGYAVQARELTQMQSILQKQVQRLGDFVLADGSPVHGGHISLDTTPTALILQPQFANTNIVLSSFLVNNKPTMITSLSSNPNTVAAIVVATDATQANPTLLVKYLTANTFVNGDTIQVATGIQSQATLVGNNSSNPASTVSIAQGIFYRGGFFVNVQPQTITLDSTTDSPTYRVGLTISENIINETEDANLLDPAQGSFNYQAPGAERYQYNLVLDKRTLGSTDDSAFFELLRVENGLITKQIDYPILGDIDTTLARRTYDEAGDFTVTPFLISMRADPANANQVIAIVEPGKAYIKGYEFSTIATQKLAEPKALTTNTITDYNMSLNFGNFLTVANVYGGNAGFFDIENYANLDIHLVPTANINTTSLANYTNTKIGTARIRNFEFLGLNTYFAYVTDVLLSPINFVAAGGSLNTITFPANFSQFANAYANVIVTVNTGGIIDTRTITNYTTPTATLNFNLSIAANNTSNCTLVFGIKDAESFANTPSAFTGNVYYAQNTTAGINSAFDVAIAGRDSTGNTFIAEQQFNCLIYPLPQQYIAQNSIVNVSFHHRKNLFSQTFTSGNLTISSGTGLGTGESFDFGFSGGYLSDLVANTNFMVMVRDKKSSNLANGQLLNFNINTVPGGNGVFQTDNTHVTVVSTAAATFVGDVLFTCLVTGANSTAVARRSKTLVGNAANTVLRATDSYLNGTQVIGNTTTYIDTANGFVWFTSRGAIPNTPGTSLSMYVADTFNVIKIYDSGNPNFMPNVSNAIDITNNYSLDTGQRDNVYNHAKLILNQGSNPPSGQTVALIQYYSHDSVQGFFDADSYTKAIYTAGTIPYYNSQKFGSFSLRDSIDFRPTRVIGSSANVQFYSLIGYSDPEPNETMTLTYQFYLGRIDKLQLTKNKVFRFLQGVPAQYPLVPADTDDAMTLYIVTLPPFTSNVSAIGIQYIENKRYTMRDIGALDTRIQQLEYYSALSQLESQSTNETILYQDGVTAKDTYGIIADDFGNFSIADNQNLDLRCYLAQNQLTCYKTQHHFGLSFANSSGGTFKENGKTFCVGYTETSVLAQNNATTAETVQPYLFAQFKGTLILTPETDSTFSANLAPVIVAPPASPAKELPPVPPPANTTTSPPVIVSPRVSPSFQADVWYNYYQHTITGPTAYYGGTGGLRVPINYSGYGSINTIDNWYGDALFRTAIPTQTSPPSNLGTPITLRPGAQITTGVVANTASIAGRVSV